jgi:hypothetical protein
MGLVGLSCAAADVGSGFWNNHASDSGRLGKRACEIVWLTTFGVALMCNIKFTDMRGYMVVFNGFCDDPFYNLTQELKKRALV